MFDVVFISFDEPKADENYERLLEIAPHAKRVHGIKGIPNAHKEAAKIVDTSHFFTVDGDNYVYDNFDYKKIIDFQKNDQRVHVWLCDNPVNGLVYGYGGVKLWPTDHVKNIQKNVVDFTTEVATKGFKVQNKAISETQFNVDEYSTWKGAFRECTKLTRNLDDPITKTKLEMWMSIIGDAAFGDYAISGAKSGTVFGLENKDDNKTLAQINDFAWLKAYYRECLDSPGTTAEQLRTYSMEPVFFRKEQAEKLKEWMKHV